MQRMFLTVTAVGIVMAACSSEPPKAAMDSSAPAAKSTVSVAPVAQSAPLETDEQKMARVLKTLADNGVYFDFDDFSVKSQYQNLIKQNYQLLQATPKLAITLVGNADERGSSEYNLALGQKRAESVKLALKSLGVPESRLEAVSYGKEKPRATCHEEKCWAENRRVDFSSAPHGGGK